MKNLARLKFREVPHGPGERPLRRLFLVFVTLLFSLAIVFLVSSCTTPILRCSPPSQHGVEAGNSQSRAPRNETGENSQFQFSVTRNPDSLIQTKLNQGDASSVCHGKDANGVREGLWECFYENGVRQWEMHYKNGKRDGAWNFWKLDGSPEFTSHWKEGLLEGEMIHYFNKDHRKLESHFKAGHLEGLEREWDPSGVQRVASEFKNGALSGRAREWYPDGQIQSEGHYVDDVLDGDYREWWPNGQLRQEGQFSKGKKTGDWRYFNPQGQVSSEFENAVKSLKQTAH